MCAERHEGSGSRCVGVDKTTATDFAYWGSELTRNIGDARTHALLRFWSERAAKANTYPPPRDAIAVEDLRPWIGALSLWDHIDTSMGFVCRLYGSSISERVGKEMTGRPVAEYPLGLGVALRVQLEMVLELHQPVLIKVSRPQVQLDYRRTRIVGIEKLFLPLTRSGDRLDCILGWSVYFEAPTDGG